MSHIVSHITGRSIGIVAAAVTFAAIVSPAQAQDWPARPIRMMIGAGPGAAPTSSPGSWRTRSPGSSVRPW